MRYFHYSQNNSGGSFQFDRVLGITRHVVIEAENAADADRRAEVIGLYFDGAGDCECCGNRWSEAYGEGDEVPSVYETPVEEYGKARPGQKYAPTKWMDNEQPEIYVHRADGTFTGYWDA